MKTLTTTEIKARVAVLHKMLALTGHQMTNEEILEVSNMMDELWAKYPAARAAEENPVVEEAVKKEETSAIKDEYINDIPFGNFADAYHYFMSHNTVDSPLCIITDTSTEEYIVGVKFDGDVNIYQKEYCTPKEVEKLRLRCLGTTEFVA